VKFLVLESLERNEDVWKDIPNITWAHKTDQLKKWIMSGTIFTDIFKVILEFLGPIIQNFKNPSQF
jgi:hypothetical protein